MKLRIEIDETPMNPRTECDQVVSLAYFHKRYDFPNDSGVKAQDYNSWDELERAICREHNVAIIVPVYMYDHSGLAFSLAPFSCPWDSGQIGFAYITREQMAELRPGWKKLTKARRPELIEAIKATVEEYGQYVTGDCYGFVLEDDDENEIDSCWGFWGGDHDKNGIKDHLEEKYHHLVDEIGYGMGEAETETEEAA